MKVVFDDEALDDLRQIFEWVANDSPRAADSLIARIFDKAERLAAPAACPTT
jgi:plasmid stabilization system protein ParE